MGPTMSLRKQDPGPNTLYQIPYTRCKTIVGLFIFFNHKVHAVCLIYYFGNDFFFLCQLFFFKETIFTFDFNGR